MKTFALLLAGLALLSCSKDQVMENKTHHIVYVGTYTSKGSDGIYVFKMDLENGRLTPLHSVKDVENPSFLAVAPDKNYLYAVHETNHFQGRRTGAVRSFAIDRKTWIPISANSLRLANIPVMSPQHRTAALFC